MLQAMRDSTAQAEKLLTLSERPWLSIDKASLKSVTANSLVVVFSFINTGHAPVIDLVAKIAGYSTTKDRKIVATSPAQGFAFPRALIGPGQIRGVEKEFPLVVAQENYANIVINLTYTDQFKRSHFASICFYFRIDQPNTPYQCVENEDALKIAPTTEP
jgi:hypothetical protein